MLFELVEGTKWLTPRTIVALAMAHLMGQMIVNSQISEMDAEEVLDQAGFDRTAARTAKRVCTGWLRGNPLLAQDEEFTQTVNLLGTLAQQ